MTIDELQEDMVLPAAKIRELLEALITEKKVEQVTTGRRIDPNKGRTNITSSFSGRNSDPLTTHPGAEAPRRKPLWTPSTTENPRNQNLTILETGRDSVSTWQVNHQI
jgi:hypothetical protein